MKNERFETALYIAGTALFLTVLMPISDAIGSLVTSAINKTINKWQIDMQLDQAEGQAAAEVISPAPSTTTAIGFAIPSEEDMEDWDDG